MSLSAQTDQDDAALPLLSPSTASSLAPGVSLSPASRTKLQGRRYLSPESSLRSLDPAKGSDERAEVSQPYDYMLSDKAKGKRPVRGDSIKVDVEAEPSDQGLEEQFKGHKKQGKVRRGRNVTVMFANAGSGETGNLELWVEDGENVGSVKDQIRHLRPATLSNSLKLIHSGRLLTDGILLLPWLRSLEERVRRQAGGMGGDMEEVLRDVGLAEDTEEGEGKDGTGGGKKEEGKVFLHCTVGPKAGEVDKSKDEDEPTAPRRRGFDVLLDAGLSQADVAHMRRQFYESRGEEVPEGLDRGDVDDEHARALEEQWIEGDLTADTATTSSGGMYSSLLNGLLAGFLYPVLPLFFFREMPLPNFFDAEAEARGEGVSGSSSENNLINGIGEVTAQSMVPQRVQMGVLLGLVINFIFGALRFMN